MISDTDIFRAAGLLIEKYGDGAPLEAAMWADEMLEKGDLDSKVAWIRIMKAVEKLLSMERPEGAEVH